jgi:hypothetical protein
MLFGRVVPVSTNSGANLLLGNCENTEPNAGANVDISRYLSQVKGMNEAEADAYLTRSAVKWVLGHPFQATTMYVLKVLNHFNFRNQLATQSEASSFRDLLVFVPYYTFLAIAITRCAFYRRKPLGRTELLLYSLYFGNALLSAIFFTRIRFRIPFDALLLAIVAISIGHFRAAFGLSRPRPGRSR